MKPWTEAMKEELEIATEHFELICEDEVEEYRIERMEECKRLIAQAKKDIENGVVS